MIAAYEYMIEILLELDSATTERMYQLNEDEVKCWIVIVRSGEKAWGA